MLFVDFFIKLCYRSCSVGSIATRAPPMVRPTTSISFISGFSNSRDYCSTPVLGTPSVRFREPFTSHSSPNCCEHTIPIHSCGRHGTVRFGVHRYSAITPTDLNAPATGLTLTVSALMGTVPIGAPVPINIILSRERSPSGGARYAQHQDPHGERRCHRSERHRANLLVSLPSA